MYVSTEAVMGTKTSGPLATTQMCDEEEMVEEPLERGVMPPAQGAQDKGGSRTRSAPALSPTGNGSALLALT